MGMEEFLQMDGLSFLGRSSPSGFSDAGFFISNAVTFGFCHNFHMDRLFQGKFLKPCKSRHGKKIPVKQEQGIAKDLCCLISVFYHLYHVGCVGNAGSIPIAELLQTVMESDAQWNACQAMNGSGKDTQPTEHMTMDKRK